MKMASEIIEHLLAGGKVILSAEKEGELEPFVWTLGWVSLASGTATAQVTTETLEEDYEIFKTKDELEIERLQAIIARQNEEIQNLNKKRTPSGRKKPKRLSDKEKLEVYDYFDKDVESQIAIASMFGVSPTTISRLYIHWEAKIKPLKQAS